MSRSGLFRVDRRRRNHVGYLRTRADETVGRADFTVGDTDWQVYALTGRRSPTPARRPDLRAELTVPVTPNERIEA
jgi:hypothetical protein